MINMPVLGRRSITHKLSDAVHILSHYEGKLETNS